MAPAVGHGRQMPRDQDFPDRSVDTARPPSFLFRANRMRPPPKRLAQPPRLGSSHRPLLKSIALNQSGSSAARLRPAVGSQVNKHFVGPNLKLPPQRRLAAAKYCHKMHTAQTTRPTLKPQTILLYRKVSTPSINEDKWFWCCFSISECS